MKNNQLLSNWPWSAPPEKVHLQDRTLRNIGNFSLRTDVKFLPDLTATMAIYNESIDKCKDVFYIRSSSITLHPVSYYQLLSNIFRHLNNGRWRKEPVGGFRLCNVVQRFDRWRFTSNIVCTGSRYAAVVFTELSNFNGSHYLYLTFKTPRKTQYEQLSKLYYAKFYERSHLHFSMCKIEMLDPYYWRLETHDKAYVVQMLFDIFGPAIEDIYTDLSNGVAISKYSNIDPKDYFETDRHRCGCRIRFIQSFGTLFKILKR